MRWRSTAEMTLSDFSRRHEVSPEPENATAVSQNGRRLGFNDHACLAYSTRSERDAAAAAWLLEGARLEQRLLVVTADEDAGAGLLAALAEAAGAGPIPQVVNVGIDDVYDLSGPIDAESQLARYSDEVARAVAEGFNGLRVFCDITALIVEPARRAGHASCVEHVADVCTAQGNPLAPLCAYDTGVLWRRRSIGNGIASTPTWDRHGRDFVRSVLRCQVTNSRRRDRHLQRASARRCTRRAARRDGRNRRQRTVLRVRAGCGCARQQSQPTHGCVCAMFQPIVRRVWDVLELDPEMLTGVSCVTAA